MTSEHEWTITYREGYQGLLLWNRCQQHTRTNMLIHIYFTNATIEQAGQALPEDVNPPISERRAKTVMFFHDKTTFQSHEDQSVQWEVKGPK